MDSASARTIISFEEIDDYFVLSTETESDQKDTSPSASPKNLPSEGFELVDFRKLPKKIAVSDTSVFTKEKKSDVPPPTAPKKIASSDPEALKAELPAIENIKKPADSTQQEIHKIAEEVVKDVIEEVLNKISAQSEQTQMPEQKIHIDTDQQSEPEPTGNTPVHFHEDSDPILLPVQQEQSVFQELKEPEKVVASKESKIAETKSVEVCVSSGFNNPPAPPKLTACQKLKRLLSCICCSEENNDKNSPKKGNK